MITYRLILVAGLTFALSSCDGGGVRPKGNTEPQRDGGKAPVSATLDAATVSGVRDGGGAEAMTASRDGGRSPEGQTTDGAQIIETSLPPPLPDGGTPLCLLLNTQWSQPHVIKNSQGLRADVVHDVSSDGRVWVYSIKRTVDADAGTDWRPLDVGSDAGSSNQLVASQDAALGQDAGVPLEAGVVVADSADDGPEYDDFIVRLPGEPQRIVLPDGITLRFGATLNTASDTLIVTLPDQTGFAIAHQNEDGDWETENNEGFGALLSAARHSGAVYSHPSFSKDGDDEILYFSVRNGGNPVLTTALWNSVYWEVVASDSSLFMFLAPNPEHRVSSVSTDNRTVFMWDADRMAATAVELGLDPARPVQIAQNIVSVAPVFVSGDCLRLFTLDDESRFVELRSEPLVPADELAN